jgi:hypothetical protein
MGEEAIMALAAKHGVFGDESWAHDCVRRIAVWQEAIACWHAIVEAELAPLRERIFERHDAFVALGGTPFVLGLERIHICDGSGAFVFVNHRLEFRLVLHTGIVPTPDLAVLLAIHQNRFADLLRADQAVVSVLDRVQSWRDA